MQKSTSRVRVIDFDITLLKRASQTTHSSARAYVKEAQTWTWRQRPRSNWNTYFWRTQLTLTVVENHWPTQFVSTIRLSHAFDLILFLDDVTVRWLLRVIHNLARETNDHRVTERMTTDTHDQVDDLIHLSQSRDIHELTSHVVCRDDPSGILSRTTLLHVLHEDLDRILVDHESDVFKYVLYDTDSFTLLSVVPVVHHHDVHQSLHNGTQVFSIASTGKRPAVRSKYEDVFMEISSCKLKSATFTSSNDHLPKSFTSRESPTDSITSIDDLLYRVPWCLRPLT